MTQTAKHTPGEWYIGERHSTGYASILAPAKEQGGPVKIICDMQMMSANYEANARLIGAAPKLLEALKIAFARSCERADSGVKWTQADQIAHEAIKAALAKAGTSC